MNEPKPLEYAYEAMQAHISKITNPVIFELGMCDGYHTHMLLSWCASPPRFFGFEPDPRNVTKIMSSGLPRRMSFYPDAIGNVTGKVPFYLSTPEPNGAVGASSISEFTPVLTQLWGWLKCQDTIEVQSWRLDDFCDKNAIDHIDFIWMDVQGSERLVFEGAPLMLPKTKLIWTEYDGGTLYKDSSTLNDVLARFPGWEVVADCGGDVLLKNPVQ
jgi:FkbM family methyltransferase